MDGSPNAGITQTVSLATDALEHADERFECATKHVKERQLDVYHHRLDWTYAAAL